MYLDGALWGQREGRIVIKNMKSESEFSVERFGDCQIKKRGAYLNMVEMTQNWIFTLFLFILDRHYTTL